MTWRLAHDLEILTGGRTRCTIDWSSPVGLQHGGWRVYRPHTSGAWLATTGGRVPLRRDRIHLLNPHRPFGYGCSRPVVIDWLHVTSGDAALTWRLANLPLPISISRKQLPGVDATLASLCPVLDGTMDHAAGLELHGALLSLFAACLPDDEDIPADPRLELLLQRIQGQDQLALDLQALARAVGWSVPHLRRRFRTTMGVTIHQHHEAVRLRRAQLLLRTTDQAIASIAAHCGWDDPQYFSRVFKRATGSSPRAWRQGNTGP